MPPRSFVRALARLGLAATCLPTGACSANEHEHELGARRSELATYTDSRAWSRQPPGLDPADVPQFVAVTFDDNFVSGLGDVSGGMTWATDFFQTLQNPAGSGFAPTFDGAPARTTFYDNCVYLQDEGTKAAWRTAREAGHELANHTVSHLHGGAFTQQDWSDEIAPCTAALANPDNGLGVSVDDVRGFRAPFLEYSSPLFATLKSQGLWYDSSLQSCWGAGDDGKTCAWPYTLDQGSPDALELTAKFATPAVPSAPGLWEMTPSALFVPPDELAAQYGFEPGLRQRVPSDMPAPSYYEPATGRIAPLDITLFVDAGLSAAEVLATLKYTLDLRLEGNRAPFIFIAHSHVYASNYAAAPKALDVSDRQHAIESFLRYALSKPVVRVRPVADVLAWMQQPQPLDGVITARPAAGGGGGTGGTAGASAGGGAGGTGGAGGAGGVSMGPGGTPPVAGSPSTPGTDESSPGGCSCRAVGRSADTRGGRPRGAALLLTWLLSLARRARKIRRRAEPTRTQPENAGYTVRLNAAALARSRTLRGRRSRRSGRLRHGVPWR